MLTRIVREKPTIWYKQTGNTCPTYGLVMLFSYITGIKLKETQFLNVNKPILTILKDGDFGEIATCKQFSKTYPADFLNNLIKNPLVCDITMFSGINYNQESIKHHEGDLKPIGGHRMLVLEHDPDEGMIYFANTSGLNKVQKIDFALFYYSLRKYMKLNIEAGLRPITPLSQTDKRWSKYRLGKSRITVGSHGCLVTSICMAMERLRGFSANPADASKYWVFSKNGYLQWTSTEFRGIDYKGMASYSLNTVREWTSNKKACILKVSKSGIPEHFVLVDSVVGDRLLIIDPIKGISKWLNDSGYRVLGLRLLQAE